MDLKVRRNDSCKRINRITGYIRGGCIPIGMKKHFKTVIHDNALEYEAIIFSGGRLGLQVEINPQLLAKMVNRSFKDVVITVSD